MAENFLEEFQDIMERYGVDNFLFAGSSSKMGKYVQGLKGDGTIEGYHRIAEALRDLLLEAPIEVANRIAKVLGMGILMAKEEGVDLDEIIATAIRKEDLKMS